MPVELRPLAEEDYALLAEIGREPAVERWWGPNDEQSLREEVAPETVTGFAILADGQLAGLLTLTEDRDPAYRYVEPDLFVASVSQDRGVGAQALRIALRAAFDRGHHRAVIQPAAANGRAIRCYEKVGFRRVGIFRQADRGQDVLAMDLLKDELR